MSSREPAIILHHRSSPLPVLQDSPRLREFQPVEHDDDFSRIGQLGVPPPPQHAATNRETPEELEILAVTDGLTALIQKHGAPRIMRLVRMLAHIAGQEV